MSYVDFFSLPIRPENIQNYKKMAQVFAEVMKENGMISYCEAVADDVPRGKVTDFYRAVASEENETVIAAYATWPDKKTRDKAWEVSMKDPRFQVFESESMPFDGKRMFWGGFVPIIEVK